MTPDPTSPASRPPGLSPEVLPDAYAEATIAHAAAALPILEELLDWCAIADGLERRLDDALRECGLVGDDEHDASTAWSGVDLLSRARVVIDAASAGRPEAPEAQRAMEVLRGLR